MVSFIKPEYLFKPSTLFTRLINKILNKKPEGIKTINTILGIKIKANTSDGVGRILWTFKIHDLIVSETIFRLLAEHDNCIDGGANIGSMTTLMAYKANKLPRGKPTRYWWKRVNF